MTNCNYGPLMEIWLPVYGYDEFLTVSNYGVVKNSRGIIIKTHNHKGYRRFSANKNGKKIPVIVHRIVCLAHIENTELKPFINHKNAIRDDSFVLNLEWCTPSENIIHAYTMGLMTVSDKPNEPKKIYSWGQWREKTNIVTPSVSDYMSKRGFQKIKMPCPDTAGNNRYFVFVKEYLSKINYSECIYFIRRPFIKGNQEFIEIYFNQIP